MTDTRIESTGYTLYTCCYTSSCADLVVIFSEHSRTPHDRGLIQRRSLRADNGGVESLILLLDLNFAGTVRTIHRNMACRLLDVSDIALQMLCDSHPEEDGAKFCLNIINRELET